MYSEQSLPRIPLPDPIFFEDVNERHVREVNKWANENGAFFAVESYEVFGKGEFGRSVTIRNLPVTMLNSVRFRLAEDPSSEKQRLFCFQEHLLGNDAPVPGGLSAENERVDDYLKSGALAHLSAGTMGIVELSGLQASRIGHGLPMFNPVRASYCGVDQILSGGALQSPKNPFGENAIKGTHEIGGHLHLLLRYGNESIQLMYVATFLDGCLIQWDWVSISDDKFQIHQSTRTLWKDFGTKNKLPFKMHGVRTHKQRPAEFYFEFDWLLGDEVSAGVFEKSTLGKMNFVP